MPFFVYGFDPKTGETGSRFFANAATEADAREQAERQGVRVKSVVPSHSTSEIVLPELPPAPPTEADVLREEVAEFNHTLEGITPRVVVTYGLVGANILVFVLMALSGVNVLDPSSADLLRWGAEYGPQTTNGQSWRLLSSLFVHIGILHLTYNMIAFLYVAPTVERMLGSFGFQLTYLTAGLAGSLWALFYNPVQLLAGASGAIFGIYGALLALLLRSRNSIPAHVSSRLRNFALFFIAYNLINSLRPDISLAAHMGGMVGGFLCGLVLARTFAWQSDAGRPARNLALAICSIVLFVGGVTIADARFPNLGQLVAVLDRGRTTMVKFRLAEKQSSNKQLSDAAFGALIERDLLPEWKTMRAALVELKPVPPSLQRNVEAIADYMNLRQAHLEALLSSLHETKARAWLHPDEKSDDKEEIHRLAQIQMDYIHAQVDLEFAKPEASDRSDKLKRLQQLAARVKSLDERDHTEDMRLSFDDYSAFLERDQLPELHSIQQGFADLPSLPRELAEDAAAMRSHLRYKQDEWEPRVAYQHYERLEKDADQKRSRANDAARAIRDMPGARLLAP